MGVKANTVILCPNVTVAQAIYDVAPDGLLPAPANMWPSQSGQYFWAHWDWPEGFTTTAEGLGADTFPDSPTWKAEHGWVDQDPPEQP